VDASDRVARVDAGGPDLDYLFIVSGSEGTGRDKRGVVYRIRAQVAGVLYKNRVLKRGARR
jgi:sugar lactone lactonase YvrE